MAIRSTPAWIRTASFTAKPSRRETLMIANAHDMLLLGDEVALCERSLFLEANAR